MLILKTLSHGEIHGYDIAEYIHERSDQVLALKKAPCIRRYIVWKFADCSRQSSTQLMSRWGASDNNRRAKYYRLTAAGRKQLAEETAHRKRMSSAIARILEPA
jgi:PadR family transcriptional regulator, regulatory protein PadR